MIDSEIIVLISNNIFTFIKNKGTTFFLRETHIPMSQPLCEGYRDNLWELVSFFCYKESRN